MQCENEIPKMLMFLFGEAAEVAQRGASERLRRWCRAYEEWLEELRQKHKPSSRKQGIIAWRRLLRQCGKMPWAMKEGDIEEHMRWMEAEGYSPATIANAVGIVANFYRWCGEREVDGECGADFNPAEKVKRPQVRRYRQAELLSREEVRRLLRTLRADTSELGKRDTAFVLARLRLGVPLRSLQRLRWGQMEVRGEEAWVRWESGGEARRLPGDAWEAIREALEASGRLAGMREEDYIFAPLVNPLSTEAANKAEVWQGERYLSSDQLLANLKLYGRLAGIKEEKLTLMALRRTATRLHLAEGAEMSDRDLLNEMQDFLGSREQTRFTKYWLGKLPEMADDESEAEAGEAEEGEAMELKVPNRKPTPFKPGEGVTHGFYARSQPAEAVKLVMAENVHGIEEELMGLRLLERELVERLEKAKNWQETVMLGEAQSLAAYRMGEMIKAEKELKGSEEAEESIQLIFTVVERCKESEGSGALTDEERAQIRAELTRRESEENGAARHVAEEVAALRYVLRKTLRLALGGGEKSQEQGKPEGRQTNTADQYTQETRELVRLAELYGSGCVRLVRLLKMEGVDNEIVNTNIVKAIDWALTDFWEEMEREGLSPF